MAQRLQPGITKHVATTIIYNGRNVVRCTVGPFAFELCHHAEQFSCPANDTALSRHIMRTLKTLKGSSQFCLLDSQLLKEPF